MSKVLLTIGASCSGKSTWAEEFTTRRRKEYEELWIRLERDEYRFGYFTSGERDWTKYKFTKKNERAVTKAIDNAAEEAVKYQYSIIISDTNINPDIRQKWKDFAENYGYQYEEKLFPCDWKELVKRNAQRQGGLSESLLWDQYKRFMQQFGYIGEHKLEVYKEDPKLDSTIIVDLDGTVASMEGIRKPYEWHKVGLDSVRYAIVAMLEGLAFRTGHVTFMSGRDGCCYDDSLEWIENNITNDWHEDIEWDLHMRSPSDMRKDDIVKYELFDKYVRNKYNVEAVLDDRPQVIRMWSLLGLPNITQVGEYNREF